MPAGNVKTSPCSDGGGILADPRVGGWAVDAGELAVMLGRRKMYMHYWRRGFLLGEK